MEQKRTKLFANEMSVMINTSLEESVFSFVHVSKDKRTIVR